eukprot:TRINITY_DN3010_c0_g1_i4.p1 TRINITY_DN3010_c0_g1~~TRINITY_DN3010_c0_g1_i4.p1  ORF type:complete len:550 (-),score=124.54 TRINITY_DN3010_c0_g1_i4:1530-3179(-)
MSDTLEQYKMMAQMFWVYIKQQPRFKQVRDVLAFIALVKYGGDVIRLLIDVGPVRMFSKFFNKVKLAVLKFNRNYIMKNSIDKQLAGVKRDLEKDILGTAEENAERPHFTSLPDRAHSREEVIELLGLMKSYSKVDYKEGKISGCVYKGGDDLTELMTHAYSIFEWSNPLHTDIFPGIRKMESEVVSMVIKLFNGDTSVQCGTTTSGGTESILMSCKAHRDWARETKGITNPNIVMPVTAHAAFDKAGHYFGIEIIHVPVDKNFVCRPEVLKKYINRNTIMIVGSCCNYPYGTIEDIEAFGQIALKRDIGLHVDCCLGGFVAPFMEMSGFNFPKFDFRVPGVTAISCDTHKYAFAPKGSSVIMYSTTELRKYQFFKATSWPGGVYASPAVAGSRPGNIIAGCWASLMYHGKEGYIESCQKICRNRDIIKDAINEVPELELMGDPSLCVVAFTSDHFDIFKVTELMSRRGWSLNSLQFPVGVHICITYLVDGEAFARDIKEVVAEIMKNPTKKSEGAAAMYGMVATLPDRSIIGEVASMYIETMYETPDE